MKFLIGTKIGSSRIFSEDGIAHPVSLVLVPDNFVLQVKTKEKDGIDAVQVGMGSRKQKNIAKPQQKHFGELGKFNFVKEFRLDNVGSTKRGDILKAENFAEGDMVKVTGISKAKGFQGVVKRHGFHGAPATHGTKHAHREAGSIGGAGGRAGGRVAKGMRMAGRMGGRQATVKKLKIIKVDAEDNIIAVSGAIPGARGSLVEIRGN